MQSTLQVSRIYISHVEVLKIFTNVRHLAIYKEIYKKKTKNVFKYTIKAPMLINLNGIISHFSFPIERSVNAATLFSFKIHINVISSSMIVSVSVTPNKALRGNGIPARLQNKTLPARMGRSLQKGGWTRDD